MASPPPVPEVRSREIRPQGADNDALAFRNVAVHLRAVGESLRGHIVRLGLNWAGRSADRFIGGLMPVPNRVDALAEQLDLDAGKIANKTVTVAEMVVVPQRGGQAR